MRDRSHVGDQLEQRYNGATRELSIVIGCPVWRSSDRKSRELKIAAADRRTSTELNLVARRTRADAAAIFASRQVDRLARLHFSLTSEEIMNGTRALPRSY